MYSERWTDLFDYCRLVPSPTTRPTSLTRGIMSHFYYHQNRSFSILRILLYCHDFLYQYTVALAEIALPDTLVIMLPKGLSYPAYRCVSGQVQAAALVVVAVWTHYLRCAVNHTIIDDF